MAQWCSSCFKVGAGAAESIWELQLCCWSCAGSCSAALQEPWALTLLLVLHVPPAPFLEKIQLGCFQHRRWCVNQFFTHKISMKESNVWQWNIFFLTGQVWESVLQFLLQFSVTHFQMLGYANRKKKLTDGNNRRINYQLCTPDC